MQGQRLTLQMPLPLWPDSSRTDASAAAPALPPDLEAVRLSLDVDAVATAAGNVQFYHQPQAGGRQTAEGAFARQGRGRKAPAPLGGPPPGRPQPSPAALRLAADAAVAEAEGPARGKRGSQPARGDAGGGAERETRSGGAQGLWWPNRPMAAPADIGTSLGQANFKRPAQLTLGSGTCR